MDDEEPGLQAAGADPSVRGPPPSARPGRGCAAAFVSAERERVRPVRPQLETMLNSGGAGMNPGMADMLKGFDINSPEVKQQVRPSFRPSA